MYKIETLKGGSLNSTNLFSSENEKFVRKSISLIDNREYGYTRWYSQLKKIQRFNKLFLDTVPKILNVGTTGDYAYFDLEYIPGDNIKNYLQKTILTDNEIEKINYNLWKAFDTIHRDEYQPNANALVLYYKEEVKEKLDKALTIEEFKRFYELGEYTYLGNTIPGFQFLEEKYQKLFDIKINSESCIHGNPTLENIMYNPETEKITFIDLYEESIVDSKFLDYSQILQCSDSGYGVINDYPKNINGSTVSTNVDINQNFNKFNKLFIQTLYNRYSPSEIQLIKLFESTQFFRMLPFKCLAGDIEGAKFFYVHACYKVNNLL
jgi:hypothetical protein